jgi:hypothetical protein
MDQLIIEKLKTEKGYIFEHNEDDYLFDLIKDTIEVTVNVYKSEQLKKIPFRGNTIEDKISFSLLRMRNFFQAIAHDRDFIVEYRSKSIKNDKLNKAIKEAFPKINFFIKVITEDLQNDSTVKADLLERNQEVTYQILEHYEQLTNKI